MRERASVRASVRAYPSLAEVEHAARVIRCLHASLVVWQGHTTTRQARLEPIAPSLLFSAQLTRHSREVHLAVWQWEHIVTRCLARHAWIQSL